MRASAASILALYMVLLLAAQPPGPRAAQEPPGGSTLYRLPIGVLDAALGPGGSLLYIDYTGVWRTTLRRPASPELIESLSPVDARLYSGGAVVLGGDRVLRQYVFRGDTLVLNASLSYGYTEIYGAEAGGSLYVLGDAELYAFTPHGFHVYSIDASPADAAIVSRGSSAIIVVERTGYTAAYMVNETMLYEAVYRARGDVYVAGDMYIVYLDPGPPPRLAYIGPGRQGAVTGSGDLAAATEALYASTRLGDEILVYGAAANYTYIAAVDARSLSVEWIRRHRLITNISSALFADNTLYVATDTMVAYNAFPFNDTYRILVSTEPRGWRLEATARGAAAAAPGSIVYLEPGKASWINYHPLLGRPVLLHSTQAGDTWLVGDREPAALLAAGGGEHVHIPLEAPGPGGWLDGFTVLDGSYLRGLVAGDDIVLYSPGAILRITVDGGLVYSGFTQPGAAAASWGDTVYTVSWDGYFTAIYGNGSAASYGRVSYGGDIPLLAAGGGDTVYVLDFSRTSLYEGYVYPSTLLELHRDPRGRWSIAWSASLNATDALIRWKSLYASTRLRVLNACGYTVLVYTGYTSGYRLFHGASGAVDAELFQGALLVNKSGGVARQVFVEKGYAATVVGDSVIPLYTALARGALLTVSDILLTPGKASQGTMGIYCRGGVAAVAGGDTFVDTAPWGWVEAGALGGNITVNVSAAGQGMRAYTLGLGGETRLGVLVAQTSAPGYYLAARVYGAENYTLLYIHGPRGAGLMRLAPGYRVIYGYSAPYTLRVIGDNYTRIRPGDTLIYRIGARGGLEPVLDPRRLGASMLLLASISTMENGVVLDSPGIIYSGDPVLARLWLIRGRGGDRLLLGDLLWIGGGRVLYSHRGGPGPGYHGYIVYTEIRSLPEPPAPPGGGGGGIVEPLAEPPLLPAILASVIAAAILLRRRRSW